MTGTYDTRAFGEFGWSFVNAGEKYRKLLGVSPDEKQMMCGIFKQATMGDCKVADPATNMSKVERQNHQEWLKHTGMDTYDAMKLYIAKVEELAKVYSPQIVEVTEDNQA